MVPISIRVPIENHSYAPKGYEERQGDVKAFLLRILSHRHPTRSQIP